MSRRTLALFAAVSAVVVLPLAAHADDVFDDAPPAASASADGDPSPDLPPAAEVPADAKPSAPPAASRAASGSAAASSTVSAGGTLANPMPGMVPGLPDTIQVPQGDPGYSGLRIKQATDEPAHNSDQIGAFRVVCPYSHMGFDDPIVKPGQPGASHLHMFFGNTGTDANSTAESLANSGNSTCTGGIANRSAYWAPALYDTRTGAPVVPELSIFYYKTGYFGIKNEDVQPMPAGLRMVAGDATATGPQDHADWGCWNRYTGRNATIPTDCSTEDDIAFSVDFPQCWNGKDLDSADHKSHMAFPVDGACPADHPVAIPAISVQLHYDVKNVEDPKYWRLASDMYDASKPGGLSIHADWFGAWNRDVLDTWIKNCDNKGVDCHAGLLGDGRELY